MTARDFGNFYTWSKLCLQEFTESSLVDIGDRNLGGPQRVRHASMQAAAASGNCGVDRGSEVSKNALLSHDWKKLLPEGRLGRKISESFSLISHPQV